MQAQKKLYNTARPGTPEFEKALAQRDAALKDYLKSRAITNNYDPQAARSGSAQGHRSALQGPQEGPRPRSSKGSKDVKGAPLAPNTASGGPVKPQRAREGPQGDLGKLGKGLGIAGTALGALRQHQQGRHRQGHHRDRRRHRGRVGHRRRDRRRRAQRSAWPPPASAASPAPGVAFGGSYLGGKYGSQIAGWAYDRGEDVGERRQRPRGQAGRPTSRRTPPARWTTSERRSSMEGRR